MSSYLCGYLQEGEHPQLFITLWAGKQAAEGHMHALLTQTITTVVQELQVDLMQLVINSFIA